MEKINGVTMNGNIVVDIDRDKDMIIIPEYTEGTTYQLPLNGIKCIQVSSLDLLCKFIGVPKTIILKSNSNNTQNDNVPYWKDSIDEFDRIFERPGLEQIVIAGNHNHYKTKDGILYSKDGKALIKCPMSRTGSIIIPEGTEIIEGFAFKECKISSVIFPDSLKRIDKEAFCDCRQLSHVDFGNGIKDIGNSIPSYIFQSCTSLEKVSFPAQIRSIGSSVFWNCSNLKEVILNNGLLKIDTGAFSFCQKIKEIHIPDSLKYIGRNNFVDTYDFYLSKIPNGFIQSITSALFTLNESSKKVNTIALHIAGEKMTVYIPRIVRTVDEASAKIHTAIKKHQSDDYANMFQLSTWPACMQDTALYTYLYSYSNKNVESFLRGGSRELACRLLSVGRTKDLVDFIKTGLVTDNVLDMLLSMVQNDSNAYDDIPLSDNDRTVIMAYIMETKEKRRKQKEQETLNKFSLQ